MPRSYGLTPADGERITLRDLRELVADTQGLDGACAIRAQPAFHGQDFTNPSGMLLREVSLDVQPGARPTGEVDRA